MPAIPVFCMNPRMTAFTKSDQVGFIMCAAFGKGELVMYLLGRNVEPALKTHLTQGVLREITITDPLPCSSVTVLGF